MDYRNVFSARLLHLRTNAGLSQRDLAQILNLTNPAITMLEHAKRSPSFEVLCALADYFDVSIDYLVGRSNDPTRR